MNVTFFTAIYLFGDYDGFNEKDKPGENRHRKAMGPRSQDDDCQAAKIDICNLHGAPGKKGPPFLLSDEERIIKGLDYW